jgi:hypothetical protein
MAGSGGVKGTGTVSRELRYNGATDIACQEGHGFWEGRPAGLLPCPDEDRSRQRAEESGRGQSVRALKFLERLESLSTKFGGLIAGRAGAGGCDDEAVSVEKLLECTNIVAVIAESMIRREYEVP